MTTGTGVAARYSCSDGGSGVASCAGDVPDGGTLDTGRPGSFAFGVTATDAAGNAATATRAWSVVAPGQPPPDPPRPPAPRPVSTSAASLPSASRCVSRRRFRIRLVEPRGDALRSATVSVNGRRVRTIRGTRLTAPVNLAGLPRGRFTVKVDAVTRSGRKLTSSRRYRTCATKRRPRR